MGNCYNSNHKLQFENQILRSEACVVIQVYNHCFWEIFHFFKSFRKKHPILKFMVFQHFSSSICFLLLTAPNDSNRTICTSSRFACCLGFFRNRKEYARVCFCFRFLILSPFFLFHSLVITTSLMIKTFLLKFLVNRKKVYCWSKSFNI